jgi:outer membrane usher protein FimD/PapC
MKVDTASYWGVPHLTAEGMSRYSFMVGRLLPHATKYTSTWDM